jgi:hypothetical protein
MAASMPQPMPEFRPLLDAAGPGAWGFQRHGSLLRHELIASHVCGLAAMSASIPTSWPYGGGPVLVVRARAASETDRGRVIRDD